MNESGSPALLPAEDRIGDFGIPPTWRFIPRAGLTLIPSNPAASSASMDRAAN